MKGSPVKRIARSMQRSEKFVRTWRDRKDEVLRQGHVHSRRAGNVGRPPMFSKEESKKLAGKLMGTSQVTLSIDLDCDVRTLRKATRSETVEKYFYRSQTI